ncbi:succinate dehydrogenase [bacterium]|nr:succinate dehydrogenase [candidate division CSSED10-310 bacterium]
MGNINKYPNSLGIGGWAVKGRWGLERYLYTLHRITGLGILLYFLLHIFVTSSRVFGSDAWSALVLGILHHWTFQVGEYLVFAAFAFHALNGIRLILIEFGFIVGKAEEPVYPYRSSINVQRPASIIVLILAAIIAVIGGMRYFML